SVVADSLAWSADDGRSPAHGDPGSEHVAARAIGGGQLLLLPPGAGGAGAREYVGGAPRGILADRADGDRILAHGNRISEHIAAPAIDGSQLLLLRPGAGGSGAREHVGGPLRGDSRHRCSRHVQEVLAPTTDKR